MANRLMKPLAGCLEAGIVKLFGVVTLGASGAISSQDCKGFTVTKTATETGRYTVTLADRYSALRSVNVMVEGSADTVYTSAKGLQALLRGVDMSAKVFYVQFVDRQTEPADAEVENSAKIYLEISLKNSSAY